MAVAVGNEIKKCAVGRPPGLVVPLAGVVYGDPAVGRDRRIAFQGNDEHLALRGCAVVLPAA